MTTKGRIGVAMGLLGAVAAVAIGILQGVPAVETLWRAVAAGACGFALGRFVFGRMGEAVVREAAGRGAQPAPRVKPPTGT